MNKKMNIYIFLVLVVLLTGFGFGLFKNNLTILNETQPGSKEVQLKYTDRVTIKNICSQENQNMSLNNLKRHLKSSGVDWPPFSATSS